LIRSRRARLTAFLAPYLLGTLILIVFPASLTFYIAFTRYNGVSSPVFVGWQNFQFLFNEPLFKIAFSHSLIFVAWAVPLRILGALALTILYNRQRRGTGLYRAAVYLPTIIPDAAYALVWTWILNPLYGPLNASLRTLGLPTPLWLADSALAFPAIIFVSLLQIGEGFVVLLAGLRHVPQVLYDSARMDGANRWQMFLSITLPLLIPWLAILTVRDVVLSFQSTFTPAYIMTRGGPYYSTFFTPLMIYETAFDRLLFGPAAAITLVVFIFTIFLVVIVFQFFDKWLSDEE
jgi:multiple sugar transport system permease protein